MEDGEIDRSLRKNNGRMKGTAHHRGNKVVYFDSNDEMVCGSDFSYSDGENDMIKDGLLRDKRT
jgi:hypothetical protein